MAQKRYILAHQDGQFLAINEGSHWIYVPDAGLATSFTQTKATNILQNMIKPKEREHWQLMPYAQPFKKTLTNVSADNENADR